MVNVKHKKCLPVTPHQTCHTAALNQTEYVTVRQVIMCKYEESKYGEGIESKLYQVKMNCPTISYLILLALPTFTLTFNPTLTVPI